MKRLEGKVALFAGLGPIFGRAAALLFAQEGARIGLAARSAEEVGRVADYLRGQGAEVATFQADVTRPEDARAIVAGTEATFGGLDVLVNVAGNYWWRNVTLADMDPDYLDEVLRNNLRGVLCCSQAALPAFERRGRGVIVTLGSADKTRLDGSIAYSAAKSGVAGLTQALARELHPRNIRVNCLCPGFMREPAALGPIAPAPADLARHGRGEDVAYAALYLASDESAWVTGQTLVVDGGDEVLVKHAYEEW
jgi:NAD(P)-dependent dehydrogenase (short-subunit alcohol dehydrogenase family)